MQIIWFLSEYDRFNLLWQVFLIFDQIWPVEATKFNLSFLDCCF